MHALRPLRWLRAAVLTLAALGAPAVLFAQADTTRRPPGGVGRDTTSVQGSIYRRPFIASSGNTSIGGYVEGNTNYFSEDGVSDGFSMEFRRFNLFLFSAIASRLRFLAELEFEHGTQEIALETAQLDFQLDPALVLRGGIILPPLGAFNQNHDSPRWEFVDRPLVSTRIIPSTLSEVGFGAYGRLRPGRGVGLTWDAYLTNGLGDGIIANDEGRTLLAAGKSDAQFAGDNNGSPALSGRLALQHGAWGELGLSYYGAIYNSFREEGVDVDARRQLRLTALDISTNLGPVSLRGEAAIVHVDIPPSLSEVLGDRQYGVHLDAVMPVLRRRMFGLPNVVTNVGVRLEHVDYNVGRFSSTGRAIRDETSAVVLGLSMRPTANAVFKANYRRQRNRDLFGNTPIGLGGYQVGFATYF